MEQTDQLIASLAETPVPVKRAAHPYALFIRWFGSALIYIGLVLCVMKLRDDITIKLTSPLYVAELLTLVLMLASSSLSAALLSFPDLFQKRLMAWTPVAALAAFAVVLGLECLQDKSFVLEITHGAECLMCITLLSLLPACFVFYTLRKQASVHYYMCGAVALLFASSIGALALRLSEKTDSLCHLLEWHYLPMIGFGVIGIVAGKIFLKW